MNRTYLIKLAHPLDSELTPSQIAGRNSVIARNLPYYGFLKKHYPHHFASFGSMHRRNKQTDFPRTVNGFIDFILYLGDVPTNMSNPTISRIDHSVGYIKENFKWESLEDNAREGALRNNLKDKGSPFKEANVYSDNRKDCKLTDNHKAKIKQSNLGKFYYTNGSVNLRLTTDNPPEGFYRGLSRKLPINN